MLPKVIKQMPGSWGIDRVKVPQSVRSDNIGVARRPYLVHIAHMALSCIINQSGRRTHPIHPHVPGSVLFRLRLVGLVPDGAVSDWDILYNIDSNYILGGNSFLPESMIPDLVELVKSLPKSSIQLFPGRDPLKHILQRWIQYVIYKAARQARIQKLYAMVNDGRSLSIASPHTLRHLHAVTASSEPITN